jgi:glycosyltransferase involved in cell wall biosynthesis
MDNITVIPNAVDTARFATLELNAEQTRHLDETKSALEDTFVVGYIGSLRSMEGVEETVDAVAELLTRGRKVKLLVVSSSANRQELVSRAESLAISENTLFTGPVPPESIKPYYQLIDAFVVSRPDTEVTRMVTPLKPLEAMLLGVPVVCSDLPALRELMDDGSKGRLYVPGDVSGLADALEEVMDSTDIAASTKNAAEWVAQNRNWNEVNKENLRLYSDLK